MDDLMEDVVDEKEVCKDAIMAVSEALINISDKINIMNGDIKNLQEMYDKLKARIVRLENKKDNLNNNITTIYENTEYEEKSEKKEIQEKKNPSQSQIETQKVCNVLMDDVKSKLLKMRRKRR